MADTNIAYLIIAWNQPQQLRRLVDRLTQPNVHFYIHIDKKTPSLEVYRNLFANDSNVTVYTQFVVYWGGFSQVRTQLFLLQQASQSLMNFKYFVFLSGQDYPIKSNEYINNFFANHHCDFLSYNRMEDLPISFTNKYRYHHYLDFKYVNPKDPHKNKLLYYLYYGFYRRLGKYLPHRSFYKNFTPYFGSDWMVLYRDTVKYIIDFAAKNKDYQRFMKYTEIPSELFILNIIVNSERRTNLSDYDKFLEFLKNKKPGHLFMPEYSSLRFMDWSEKGKGVDKPAVLDESYFEEIKNDKNLFARKLDFRKSAALYDLIDAQLLHVAFTK